MKPRNRQHRSLNISNSRWTAYVVAGLATASGGAISAEAEIHYSGPVNFAFNDRLGGTETHSFPLSQGAVLVGIRDVVGFHEHDAVFKIKGAAVSNALRVYPYSYSYRNSAVNALPRGSVVSQGYFWPFGRGSLQYYNCGFPGWQEEATHFIGFRFNSGAGMQYGWVRIKWGGCGLPGGADNRYIVKDYAWGDLGDQIKTGQKPTHEDETQVAPQAVKSAEAAPLAESQGSLGLLALGAVGLRAWRRSRSRTAGLEDA
jgi:hypothetical protein